MTVLDASVIVSALGNCDDYGGWAESVWAGDFAAAPEYAVVEATNAFRRLELRGTISAAGAHDAQQALLRMDLRLFRFAPFAKRVWELRHRLTAYDACYVALAESFGARLATLDRRLARTAKDYCEVISPAPPGAAGG